MYVSTRKVLLVTFFARFFFSDGRPGIVPKELGKIKTLARLDLSGNKLTSESCDFCFVYEAHSSLGVMRRSYHVPIRSPPVCTFSRASFSPDVLYLVHQSLLYTTGKCDAEDDGCHGEIRLHNPSEPSLRDSKGGTRRIQEMVAALAIFWKLLV